MVGLGGLEPPASPLSGVRSNHLSYRPRDRAPEPTPASPEPGFAAAVDEESGHGWPVLIFALRDRMSREVQVSCVDVLQQKAATVILERR